MPEPFRENARTLADLGWPVLPVGRPGGGLDKEPAYVGPTGGAGEDLDASGIYRATLTHGGCNIALRCPVGVIGIDVDNYPKTKPDGTVVEKRGLETLEKLEVMFGPLPRTVMTTARRGGSGIRWFRIPAGVYLPGDLGNGLDVIQRHHRYGMAPGSVHPELGAVYRSCDSLDDSVVVPLCPPGELPELPERWVTGLAVVAPKVGRAGRARYGEGMYAVAALPEEEPCKGMCTVRDRWLDKLRTPGAGRHDAMRSGIRALIGMHADGHRGVQRALTELVGTFEDETASEPGRNTRAEWHRAVDQGWHKFGGEPDETCTCGTGSALDGRVWERYGEGWIDEEGEAWVEPETFSYREMLDQLGLLEEEVIAEAESIIITASAREEEEPPEPPPLVECWETRPELRAIRDWARARRVSPWTLFGTVLLRALYLVPPCVVLPPLVGGVGSLNLFVAVVGSSGQGKDSAAAAAADGFPLPERPALWPGLVEDEWPYSIQPGSGEGFAHAFARRVPLLGRGKGSRETVVEQYRTSAIFPISEVDTLVALGARQGATLMGVIRDLFGAAALGHNYVDPEKRVPVSAHAYRAGVWLGVQPENAGPLLTGRESTGGTPQRLLWLPGDDPEAPDIAPPAPDPWEIPKPFLGGWLPAGGGRYELDVPGAAREDVDAARLERLRGRARDPLAGHKLFMQLKVAAALMVLADRAVMKDDDWDLAHQVMKVSERTKASVLDVLSAVQIEENDRKAVAEGMAAARRADTTERVTEARLINRLLRYIEAAGPAGIPWKDIANKHLKLKERSLAKDLLRVMVDEGRLTLVASRYRLKGKGS